jgi:hypothetical protein
VYQGHKKLKRRVGHDLGPGPGLAHSLSGRADVDGPGAFGHQIHQRRRREGHFRYSRRSLPSSKHGRSFSRDLNHHVSGVLIGRGPLGRAVPPSSEVSFESLVEHSGKNGIELGGGLDLQALQFVHRRLQPVQLGHDSVLLGKWREGES